MSSEDENERWEGVDKVLCGADGEGQTVSLCENMGGGTFCILKGVRRMEATIEVTRVSWMEKRLAHIRLRRQQSQCRWGLLPWRRKSPNDMSMRKFPLAAKSVSEIVT